MISIENTTICGAISIEGLQYFLHGYHFPVLFSQGFEYQFFSREMDEKNSIRCNTQKVINKL